MAWQISKTTSTDFAFQYQKWLPTAWDRDALRIAYSGPIRNVCVTIIFCLLGGCSVPHLKENTIDIGGSAGSIYTVQVINSLQSLSDDPNTIPPLFYISAGSVKTQSSVTPGVNLPLGNTVTRTVVTDGVSQIVTPFRAFTLAGTEEWDQSWNIAPAKSARSLGLLRDVYNYVLGHSGVTGPGLVAKFNPPPPKVPAAQSPPSALPPAAPTPASDPFADVRPLVQKVTQMCPSSGCFLADSSGACPKSPDGRVCLDKYQTTYERLTQPHQMTITQSAYDAGVLGDLVLISLQLLQTDNASSGSKPPSS
jgi:hypothetical protein